MYKLHPNHTKPIQRSTFEWNKIIRHSSPHQALAIYLRSVLPSSSSPPNKFTFTFLFKKVIALTSQATHRLIPLLHCHLFMFNLQFDPFLCSSLISAYSNFNQISTVHQIFTHCRSKDTVLHTALVSAYAKCGMHHHAQTAFDKIPNPNSVSWAALISAYTNAERHLNALIIYSRMRKAKVEPTEACLVSALFSSTALCNLKFGKYIHGFVMMHTDTITCAVGTALLNMYAKCGHIEDSIKVFDDITDKDRLAWTSMISSLASHGYGEKALELFDDFLIHGMTPDHIMYVSILHACSHNSRVMVDEAKEHFDAMQRKHGIRARAEHYGCMVDVLGRGGRVEEAFELVKSMPVRPDQYVLKSLMSACCKYEFVKGAEWAAEKMKEVDVGNASSYVMLANLYAEMGRWDESERVRKLMRVRGVPKAPGSSAIT